jgi:hypothetical protein
MVENTLDQCVQRLRKRIADEADKFADELQAQQELAAATGFNASGIACHPTATASSAAGHGSKPMAKKDRTPSFYTSKSLVNMSGLSVADRNPLPVHQPRNTSSGGSSRPNNQHNHGPSSLHRIFAPDSASGAAGPDSVDYFEMNQAVTNSGKKSPRNSLKMGKWSNLLFFPPFLLVHPTKPMFQCANDTL